VDGVVRWKAVGGYRLLSEVKAVAEPVEASVVSCRLPVAGYELTVERRYVDFVFKSGTIENLYTEDSQTILSF
jgi:hypothetical protein